MIDLSDKVMELVELLGNHPDAIIEEKAWEHLKVYIPKEDSN